MGCELNLSSRCQLCNVCQFDVSSGESHVTFRWWWALWWDDECDEQDKWIQIQNQTMMRRWWWCQWRRVWWWSRIRWQLWKKMLVMRYGKKLRGKANDDDESWQRWNDDEDEIIMRWWWSIWWWAADCYAENEMMKWWIAHVSFVFFYILKHIKTFWQYAKNNIHNNLNWMESTRNSREVTLNSHRFYLIPHTTRRTDIEVCTPLEFEFKSQWLNWP